MDSVKRILIHLNRITIIHPTVIIQLFAFVNIKMELGSQIDVDGHRYSISEKPIKYYDYDF